MSKKIQVKTIAIGGGSRITVQSMTNTKTADVEATVAQINGLEAAGCDLVRCSVPDQKSAEAFSEIVQKVQIPVVADIHFDYRLAVAAAEAGAAKIRINPGNIGASDKVRYLADCLKAHHIPIRIGVNAGSLEKEYADFSDLAAAMASSALAHVKRLEDVGFDQIVVSVKSSDVATMVRANRILAASCPYPLHLGVTEAGLYQNGLIKSAAGIGALLLDGIGDTVRVSLTDDPVEEIYAARAILRNLGIDRDHVEIISCPTCARTEIDVISLAKQVSAATKDIQKPLKVAVMGCIVNGIGESKGADVGIAGGKERSILFYKGEKVKTVDNAHAVNELMKMIYEVIKD